LYILSPDLSEEEIEAQRGRVMEILDGTGAKVKQSVRWAKRRLAYPINKKREGHYFVMMLETEKAESFSELEREFKQSTNVLRHLITRHNVLREISETAPPDKSLREYEEERRAERLAALQARDEARAAQQQAAAVPAEEEKTVEPTEEEPAVNEMDAPSELATAESIET
jgi:small subunit ribosomal protein S6